MIETEAVDPLILGRRVRHIRKQRDLTLDQLGELVGKPAPYLSMLENGKKVPRIDLVIGLSNALGVDLENLLDSTPPNRRDALEVALLRLQTTALFESLGLPAVKPSAKMDDETLQHLVGMHEALRQRSGLDSANADDVRRANGLVAKRVEAGRGYIAEVEESAAAALAVSGYSGDGPFTSRNLTDLTAHAGFEIHPVDDMPPTARSIIDLENRRIYIAQRNELRTRQARKAVLQTLAGFLLDHESEPDLDTFMMQRMETAYFAAAVLAPESGVVARLLEAKKSHDIDAEDIKEFFYLSYEMAAWRTANLITHHLGISSHLLVSEATGAVVKGYVCDDVPVPRDPHGGMETQLLCRHWGARRAFDSEEKFDAHHQFTDTPAGTYFCSTHVEAGREPARAVTFGVRFADARWFRGRDTEKRETSGCPDPSCCRLPPSDLAEKWSGRVVVSARSQDRILGMMAPDPYPAVDIPTVLAVVDHHADDTSAT